jgi:RND family efflux transporter MFP subunit
MSKILKVILPIIFIAAGVGIAAMMISNPVKPKHQAVPELVELVDVMTAEMSNRQIVIEAKGTVIPAKQIVVTPQLSGKIISMSPKLVPGGVFRRGDQIIAIDPRDYEIALEASQERVADAIYRLKMEKGQAAVAQQEWKLLEDSVPTTEEGKELALRKPQIEKAEASLKAAKSGVRKAEINLSRTRITAPFNSIVLTENVDMGQVVGPQSQVAMLAGTDVYWIQVSVPVEYLSKINIPKRMGQKGSEADLIIRSGSLEIKRKGYVVRLLGDIEKAGRLARLLVAVEDPMLLKNGASDEQPLLLGSFVEVNIFGEELENIYVLPRKAMRDVEETVAGEGINNEWLWVVDEDSRLRFKEVEVAWRLKNEVFVSSGLEGGETIITNSIPTPIEGLKVEIKKK